MDFSNIIILNQQTSKLAPGLSEKIQEKNKCTKTVILESHKIGVAPPLRLSNLRGRTTPMLCDCWVATA